MAAPRGLWMVNHPFVAIFVGLGVLVVAFYAAIFLAVIGVVVAVCAGISWLASKASR